MSAFYPIQATFNNGELTPLLGRRDNIDFWAKSLAQCLNFDVLAHGGIRRSSGTKFVREVADSTQITRLFPFVFSVPQAYVIAFNGNGTVRFHANRGTVENLGSPYEIAHSYAGGDFYALSYEQVNDVAWIAHWSYPTAKLNRISEANWSIGNEVFKNGPWLPAPDLGTTLTPSDTSHITPLMTSNSAPAGIASAGNGSSSAFVMFNRVRRDSVEIAPDADGYIRVQLASAGVADAYWLTAGTKAQNGNYFQQWEFRASNNGSTWITLDSRQAESGWGGSETRYFEFKNEAAYLYYEVTFSGGGGSDGLNTEMAELAIHRSAATQTPFSLTASSTAGINDGVGFVDSDVGRPIRLWGGDNRWRWAEIKSRVSPTVVTIVLHGQALPDTSPISRWQLGAFSESSGFPGSVTLFKERLGLARTDSFPLGVYLTKQGIFDDYGVSEPLVETDSVTINLLASGMSEILWIIEDEDLISGSAGQIRAVGPADFTSSFSAVNVTQRKGPTNGAERVAPLSIGGTNLYVGRGGTKIRELVLGDQNRYVAPELSILGEHVFQSPIIDWCFRESPEPCIFAVLTNGEIGQVAYDREQKIVGVARRDVGGIVESIACIPSQTKGFDDVYVVVRRTINGVSRRYVEVLDHPFDWVSANVDNSYFVNCGLTYNGAPISVLSGLGHLEGEAVKVLADGAVVKGLTVTAGTVTLPYAASKVHIGLPYLSRALTHPVSGPQQDGSLFGRRINVTGFKLDVLASGSAKVGAYTGNANFLPVMTEAILRTGNSLFGNKVELVTGTFNCEIDGSWAEGGGQVLIETDEPLPLLVRAVIPQVEGEP